MSLLPTSSMRHLLLPRQIHSLMEIPSTRNRCRIRNTCSTLLRSSVISWMSSKHRWKAAWWTSRPSSKLAPMATCTSQWLTDQPTTCNNRSRLSMHQTKAKRFKRMKNTTFLTWLKSNWSPTKTAANQEALNLVRSKAIQEYRLPKPTLRQEALNHHNKDQASTSRGITATCSQRLPRTCWTILIYWSSAMDIWLIPTTSKWKIKPMFFNKSRTSLMLSKIISWACNNKNNSIRERCWLRSHRAPLCQTTLLGSTLTAMLLLLPIILWPTSHSWTSQSRFQVINHSNTMRWHLETFLSSR